MSIMGHLWFRFMSSSLWTQADEPELMEQYSAIWQSHWLKERDQNNVPAGSYTSVRSDSHHFHPDVIGQIKSHIEMDNSSKGWGTVNHMANLI